MDQPKEHLDCCNKVVKYVLKLFITLIESQTNFSLLLD